MFEMLGNQFFMVRNYGRAAEMLQQASWKDPRNKLIRRKLVICYTQTGEVEKALENFTWLINEDFDFIANIDPVAEDCPCSGLVYDMEEQMPQNQDSPDFYLILGMLWLYCDLERSLGHFLRARQLNPADERLKSIILLIQSRLDKTEKAHSPGTGRSRVSQG